MLLVLGIVVTAVPWLARVELRLIPASGNGIAKPGHAEIGYALSCTGTFAVWQAGAVLHPSAPWAAAAAGLFAAGVMALRRVSASTVVG